MGKIAGVDFQAVFIADTAERLELLAPALAAADIWASPTPSPAAAGRPTGGRRDVLLLSTASGLGHRLIKEAGRYVQGAVLAPGYYADETDPRTQVFAARHRALFDGQNPGVTEAYVFDAVGVLRTAALRGAQTRADLLRLLAGQTFDGVTGSIRFGADHRRADPPALYVVDADRIRALR
jgi:ABC-type branched-subunit amino acid transport system substrate-binding protein